MKNLLLTAIKPRTIHNFEKGALRYLRICFLILMSSIHLILFSQPWKQKGNDILGEESNENLGGVLDINGDGNMIVIGSSKHTSNIEAEGYVRVYTWKGSEWVLKGKEIIGKNPSDRMGRRVCISADGKTILTSVTQDLGNLSSTEKIIVFTWTGSKWIKKGDTVQKEPGINELASALDGDGNTLVLGHSDYHNGKGRVRVFTWQDSMWKQKGRDLIGEAHDAYGQAVSITPDGNILAFNSKDKNDYVSIFIWQDTAWVQRGLNIEPDGDDNYCRSISLNSNGDVIAIGRPSYYNPGHVSVYLWNGISWVKKGEVINGKKLDDHFGLSVDLSGDGNTLAIGAFLNDDGGIDAGQVKVYTWDGSKWVQQSQELDGYNGEGLGYSVRLSSDGRTLVTGAPGNNTPDIYQGGLVRVYTYNHNASKGSSLVKVPFTIYPNPVQKKLTLALGQQYHKINLSVKNFLGEEMSSIYIDEAETIEMEIDDVSSGLYFFEVRTLEGGSVVLKVIKE